MYSVPYLQISLKMHHFGEEKYDYNNNFIVDLF